MPAKTNCAKNGNKYYRVTATVGKKLDGTLIRKEFYGKSKTEAENKRDEYLQGLKKGLSVDYDKVKLGSMMHLWLFEVLWPSEMKPATFDKYEGLFRNYVKTSELISLQLFDVRSIQIQRYYNNLYETKKATPKTIKNIHKLLRYFFNYCIAEDYIVKNPCFKLTIPGSVEEKKGKKMDPFTDEEINLLKKALPGNKIEMAVLLSLGTGIREGELLGLSFEDIDLENMELHVKKHLKRVKYIKKDASFEYKRILQTPKTPNSLRTVPIPKVLISHLRHHLIKQKEKFLRQGIPYTPEQLIFTTELGGSIDDKNLLRAWKRVLKKAGVRYRNFHTIRHTYATKLFEKGVPLKTVSILLGHYDIKITADTYTHVMPKEKIRAVDTLNEMLS